MKKHLPLSVTFLFFILLASCGHKYYTASNFEEQTMEHRIVAILPAEMIFTGKQPKDMTPEQIAEVEEEESRAFQVSLYNNILRNANTRKYVTTINFQDVFTTQKLLEENHISVRDSWKKNDKELAQLLGVDAVIRMRIQKQRYMSDVASYGIDMGRRIMQSTPIGSKIPVPYNVSKTNDINASCNLISENQTLWNDHYRRSADWNTPANEIIEGITENFGEHFPYKKKRKKRR